MNFILSKQPGTSFLILSPDEDSDLMLEAIRSGAKGYLPKNVSRSVLLKSLQALQRGEIALSRLMTAEIALELHRMSKVTLKNPDDTITALTYRELQVLRLLVNEASNSEIARQLFISDNTVRVHVHRILEKLRARNRREAARFAQRLGIQYKG
jgi:two-component system nitrate/nitrite response regulator NarL